MTSRLVAQTMRFLLNSSVRLTSSGDELRADEVFWPQQEAAQNP